MSQKPELWSSPTNCLLCRYPLAAGQSVCGNCGAPQEPWSLGGARLLFRQLLKGLVKLGEWSIILSAIAGFLYLCFTISPVLTLFPVFLVLSSSSRS